MNDNPMTTSPALDDDDPLRSSAMLLGAVAYSDISGDSSSGSGAGSGGLLLVEPDDQFNQSTYWAAQSKLNGTWSQLLAALFLTGDRWNLQWANILLATVLILLMLTTAIGNLFVIVAILIERNLRTVGNYLVLSLAIADLLVACLVMPLAGIQQILESWTLGIFWCDMWTSTDVFCCTAIALDRYWAVTRVNYIRCQRNEKRILLMIFLVWCAALVISLAPAFGWKDEKHEWRITIEHECLISQDIGYQIFATCTTFYFPLTLTLVFYWKIYQVARKRIRRKPGNRVKISLQQPSSTSSISGPVSRSNKPSPPGHQQHQSKVARAASGKFQTKLLLSQSSSSPRSGQTVGAVPSSVALATAASTNCQCQCHASSGNGSLPPPPPPPPDKQRLPDSARQLPDAKCHMIAQHIGPAKCEASANDDKEEEDRDNQISALARQSIEIGGSSSAGSSVGSDGSSCNSTATATATPTGATSHSSAEATSSQLGLPANGKVEPTKEPPPGSTADTCDATNDNRPKDDKLRESAAAPTCLDDTLAPDAINNGRQLTKKQSVPESHVIRTQTGDTRHDDVQAGRECKRCNWSKSSPNCGSCGQRQHQSDGKMASAGGNSFSLDLHDLSIQSGANCRAMHNNQSQLPAHDDAIEQHSKESKTRQVLSTQTTKASSCNELNEAHEDCCDWCCDSGGESDFKQPPCHCSADPLEPTKAAPVAADNVKLDLVVHLAGSPSSSTATKTAFKRPLPMSPDNQASIRTLSNNDPLLHHNNTNISENVNFIQICLRRLLATFSERAKSSRRLLKFRPSVSTSMEVALNPHQINATSQETTPIHQHQQQQQANQQEMITFGNGQHVIAIEQPCKVCHCVPAAPSTKSPDKIIAPNQLEPLSNDDTRHLTKAAGMVLAATTANIAVTAVGPSLSATSASLTAQNNQQMLIQQQQTEGIESKRERKAAKTLAIITGVFVMCWLPFFIMAITMPLLNLKPHKYVFALMLWLGYANSMLNPIIYTIFSPDFRTAFKRLLCGLDNSSEHHRRRARHFQNSDLNTSSNTLKK